MADWNTLATNVNNGTSTYSGKYFRLTDDISVTTMVGTSSNKFSGTFDGNGHTLTFNQISSEQYIAPFRYIKGATIKNLTVSGSVTSSNKFAGGVVAHATAAGNTITNCVNSTIINATISGNGSHGGILGQLGGTGGVTISGCVFNGKMLGTNTDYWCGIMGYTGKDNYNNVTIIDCLFDPEDINVKASNYNYTICRPGPAVNNAYYNTEAAEMSQKQGKQAYSITGNTDVTVVNVGTATNYTVSGITSYGTGIEYNGILYAGDGDIVSLNLSYTGSHSFRGYVADNGTLSGNENPYTLIMPESNVMISLVSNCPSPTDLTVSNIGTNEATVRWTGYVESYNLRYRSSNEAIITLIAGDVWEDGSGYQMLLDADATAYGTIIPESGRLTSSGEASPEVYEEFEYKIPRNADGSCSTQNMVFNNSVTIQIPAGTYDWCITNPTPGECVYIASSNGNISGRYDDFVFEAGKAYVFTVSFCSECDDGSGSDRVDLTINGQQISRDVSEWTVVNNVTTPSYTITNLNDDVSYEVQVQAFCENENEYSNWSSGIIFITREFSGFTKEIIGYGTGNGNWYLIASPIVENVAPTAVDSLVAEDTRDFDLYRFNQAAEKEWENWKALDENGQPLHPDFTSLESGRGYLYANKDDVTLTFTGTLYDDDGTIDLEYSTANLNEGMHGWNLIGNPFATEATIDQPFIRMNESGTALTVQVEAGNTVAAMEGVFVQATAANQTASFTTVNKGRDGGKGMIPMLNISLSHDRGEVLANAIVRFDGGQTLGSLSFREDDSKFYIPQNGKDYAIVSVGNVGEMPLNFKANENGQYTISVNPEGVEMGYLHLIDNLTGADVDLLASNGGDARPCVSTYTFEAKTTDYESRFKLVFSVGPSTGSGTFAFVSNGNIIVNGEGTLQIIDILGRQISSQEIHSAFHIRPRRLRAAPYQWRRCEDTEDCREMI